MNHHGACGVGGPVSSVRPVRATARGSDHTCGAGQRWGALYPWARQAAACATEGAGASCGRAARSARAHHSPLGGTAGGGACERQPGAPSGDSRTGHRCPRDYGAGALVCHRDNHAAVHRRKRRGGRQPSMRPGPWANRCHQSSWRLASAGPANSAACAPQGASRAGSSAAAYGSLHPTARGDASGHGSNRLGTRAGHPQDPKTTSSRRRAAGPAGCKEPLPCGCNGRRDRGHCPRRAPGAA